MYNDINKLIHIYGIIISDHNVILVDCYNWTWYLLIHFFEYKARYKYSTQQIQKKIMKMGLLLTVLLQ